MGTLHSCADGATNTASEALPPTHTSTPTPTPMLEVPEFSATQKSLIRSSWAEVQSERRSKVHVVGADSFSDLFEHSPAFKAAFGHFKHLDARQLRHSPLLTAHAMSVLHVLEQLVNLIDHRLLQSWNQTVATLAARHVNRTVKPAMARDVASQSWTAIRKILQDRKKLDDETEAAWLLLINWLGAAMEFHLNLNQNLNQPY